MGGMSENILSKRFNVDRGVIRRRLVELGVHIRSQSEAEALKWKQMTSQQRKHQVKACHDKVRGSTKTYESLCVRAKGMQAHFKPSKLEQAFLEAFQDGGINVVPWFAIGKFNVDFALPKSKIAIEVDGGNWHNSAKKKRQDAMKTSFLTSLVWCVIRFKSKDLVCVVQTIKSLPSFRS